MSALQGSPELTLTDIANQAVDQNVDFFDLLTAAGSAVAPA